MGKHTPGPLTYRKGGGHATFYVEAPCSLANEERWLVAEVHGRTLAENEANARLFAETHNMLDAIRRLVGDNRDLRDFPQMYDDARALLARIDGES